MHDPSGPFILLFIFGMFMIMRRGGFGPWRHMESRMKQEIAELRSEKTTLPRNVATLDQVQMLEDRVRVLERIVTDQNYSLARDIEALRDEPAPRQASAHKEFK